MEAVVVGIKKVNFTPQGEKDPVKRTVYFVNHPGENVEGFESNKVSWDEVTKGEPPKIAIGEIIEVEMGNNSKLRFPLDKITDKFRITVESTE